MTNLEKECDSCKGTGITKYKVSKIYLDGGFYPKCPSCNGRGKILTDEGREILDALKYYLIEDRVFEPYKENEY